MRAHHSRFLSVETIYSIQHTSYSAGGYPETCVNRDTGVPFQALTIPPGKDSLFITYTYSVTWEVSDFVLSALSCIHACIPSLSFNIYLHLSSLL